MLDTNCLQKKKKFVCKRSEVPYWKSDAPKPSCGSGRENFSGRGILPLGDAGGAPINTVEWEDGTDARQDRVIEFKVGIEVESNFPRRKPLYLSTVYNLVTY